MDVVLGVAVTGQVARLALVDAAVRGNEVIDQYSVDITGDPVATLSETVAGTNRLLTDEGHRLVATRLVWSDPYRADQLRQALDYAGVRNVQVVSESDAATALLNPARAGAAVLLIGDQTATLAVSSGDPDAPPTMMASTPVEGDAGSTFDTLMSQIPGGTPDDVLVLGTSPDQTSILADRLGSGSTMSIQVPPDPTMALAHGAAANGVSATMANPAVPGDGSSGSPFGSPVDQSGLPAGGSSGSPFGSPVDQSGLPAGDATMAAQALPADATMAAQIPGDGNAFTSSGDGGLPGSGDATAYVSSPDAGQPGAGDEQLAYSQASEYDILPVDDDGFGEYGDEYGVEYGDEYADGFDDGFDEDDPDAVGGSPHNLKRLLISNAVMAFAVMGFASLAVAVAVTVRPTAASTPVEGHQNAQPGKFMPLLPTEQQAPVPPPRPEEPTVGFQGGTIPAVQGTTPRQGTAPAETPAAPVPAAPVPVPVPVIIPFPGWQPGWPLVTPPTTPPTTTYTTPSTSPPSTTAPTTTAPTTTHTTPPTTTAPTTAPTTTAPTTQAPTTTAPTQAPTTTVPPTTAKPPSTTVAPQPTQAPQTQAPQTQAPAPQTQGPAPQTQAPAPQTQAPAPQTQAPAPQTQAPKPQTQAPKPQTQAPKPQTQAPKPQTQAPKPKPKPPSRGGTGPN